LKIVGRKIVERDIRVPPLVKLGSSFCSRKQGREPTLVRAPAAEIVPGVAGIPGNSVSERIEEIDQILLLLASEPDAKALVIEVHHIHQTGCGTVVEVRRAGSQSAQKGGL
jgi:hypothetical protein